MYKKAHVKGLGHPRGMEPLKPLPIEFDQAAHRYTWSPTGQRLTFSVTRVLRASKSKRTLDTFERTKSVWQPRGEDLHYRLLEQFLRGVPMEDLLGGPYDDWLIKLLEYPLWETFEVLATEYRVCDLRRNIGGSLDLLGYDHGTDCMVLLDLKTLGRNSKPYNTDAQLGGYLSMLIDHHKLVVDECLTMWCAHKDDGGTHLGSRQPPDQCLEAWEDAYSFWQKLNPPL